MPISSFYEGDGEDLPAMATLTSNQLPQTNQAEKVSPAFSTKTYCKLDWFLFSISMKNFIQN